MEYSTSTKKIFDFVTKSCKRKKTRKSATPTQIIPLDEQTKNDFELRHDTKLKDTMIYLDPDYNFRLSPALLAFAVENRIHIRKSKYNPGSTETDQIIEHELIHVQHYSEGRTNESVDELEMEANFNETLRLHNGEEVRYVEYAPGKYWETTEKEYKIFLNQVATKFEWEAEGKLRSMTNAEQLKYLLSLQEWANDPSDEPFSLRSW